MPTASAVIVVCGSDATNAEVVAAISDLERAPDAGPLNAAVHLSDAGLCALMRHQSLRTATRGVRFDFFDVYSAGARLFLSYHPLADAANGGTPHLMIVGLGQFGRCLLEATARAAQDGDTAITIIDRDADARLQAVLLAQPGLAERAGSTPSTSTSTGRAATPRSGCARRWHRASRRSRSASTTTRGQSRRRS